MCSSDLGHTLQTFRPPETNTMTHVVEHVGRLRLFQGADGFVWQKLVPHSLSSDAKENGFLVLCWNPGGRQWQGKVQIAWSATPEEAGSRLEDEIASERSPTGVGTRPMTEFKIGDRVRVLNLHSMGPYAGRAGKVAWFARQYPGGPPLSYVVLLDEDAAHHVPRLHAVFASGDLEPEERSG